MDGQMDKWKLDMNPLVEETAEWEPGETYTSDNYVITDPGNGLLPIRHQAITWTSADLL